MPNPSLTERVSFALKNALSTVGPRLPLSLKIALARRSTKLGHLLRQDGDFIFSHYLGSLRVHINAKNTTERVMLTGIYERDLDWVIKRYVSEGSVCVDIGANIGAVTLSLAKAVGKKGKVLSFEPGSEYCTRLKSNLTLNPEIASVVEVFNLGVADKKGVLKWAEDSRNPGNACLFKEKGIDVPVITLDGFLEPQLGRLDFMKIDVEGMELEVIRGAKTLLRRLRPTIFFESSLEFESHRGFPVRKQLADLLTDLGYSLHRVTSRGRLSLVEYPHFSQNTLALPSPKPAQA